jgi:GTP-binding protein EngB required for normal cell division
MPPLPPEDLSHAIARTEREIILEYLKTQEQSLALLIEQMDKVDVPEPFRKMQKIKLSAYRIVLADLTSAEGMENHATP